MHKLTYFPSTYSQIPISLHSHALSPPTGLCRYAWLHCFRFLYLLPGWVMNDWISAFVYDFMIICIRFDVFFLIFCSCYQHHMVLRDWVDDVFVCYSCISSFYFLFCEFLCYSPSWFCFLPTSISPAGLGFFYVVYLIFCIYSFTPFHSFLQVVVVHERVHEPLGEEAYNSSSVSIYSIQTQWILLFINQSCIHIDLVILLILYSYISSKCCCCCATPWQLPTNVNLHRHKPWRLIPFINSRRASSVIGLNTTPDYFLLLTTICVESIKQHSSPPKSLYQLLIQVSTYLKTLGTSHTVTPRAHAYARFKPVPPVLHSHSLRLELSWTELNLSVPVPFRYPGYIRKSESEEIERASREGRLLLSHTLSLRVFACSFKEITESVVDLIDLRKKGRRHHHVVGRYVVVVHSTYISIYLILRGVV